MDSWHVLVGRRGDLDTNNRTFFTGPSTKNIKLFLDQVIYDESQCIETDSTLRKTCIAWSEDGTILWVGDARPVHGNHRRS